MKLRSLTSEQSGFFKGVLSTSLVFTACSGIGLYFLHQRHEDELDKVERDTAKMCLDVATEHYEKSLLRRCKATGAISSGEVDRWYSEMTGYEATPEEWAALEKELEQCRKKHEQLMQAISEKDAKCRAELERLHAQIYMDSDCLNKECVADRCNHENM